MTEVLFYHLTESTLEGTPCRRCWSAAWSRGGWRAAVTDGERGSAATCSNNHLWIYRDDSFLAHGTDGAPPCRAPADPADEPGIGK